MTNEAKHTQEPWILDEMNIIGAREVAVASVYGADDFPCLDPDHDKEEDIQAECEANARRIVAAVNACAGIPTERLEQNTRLAIGAEALCAQRDALAEALRELVACKDLKDSLEAQRTHVEWMVVNDEYERRQSIALSAARALLASLQS